MTVFTLVGDIKFFYLAKTAETLGPADMQVQGNALLRDPGLETAVLISLFSDARAANDDALPGTQKLRGGYFGSLLVGFNFGSKLWLLGRSKIDATTLKLAEQYAQEALEWMITDSIAETIEATAVKASNRQIDFTVTINRKNVDDVYFKFYVNWQYQTIGGLAA